MLVMLRTKRNLASIKDLHKCMPACRIVQIVIRLVCKDTTSNRVISSYIESSKFVVILS